MRDRRVGFHEFLLYVHSVRLFSLTFLYKTKMNISAKGN